MIDTLFSDKQLAARRCRTCCANEFVLLQGRARPDPHGPGALPGASRTRWSRCGRGAGRSSASCRAICSRRWRWTCCWMTSVKLVSLIGSAGTGKTLLAHRRGHDQGAQRADLSEAACARPDHAAGPRHRLSARRQGPEAHRLDAADLRQHGLPALQPPDQRRRAASRTHARCPASSSASSS